MRSGTLLKPAGTQLSKPGKEMKSANNPGNTKLTAKHSAELAVVQLYGPLTPPTSSATKFTTKKRRRSVNRSSDGVAVSPLDCNQSSRAPFPSPTRPKTKRQRRPICSEDNAGATDVTLLSLPLRSKAEAPKCAKAGTESCSPVTTSALLAEAQAKEKHHLRPASVDSGPTVHVPQYSSFL